MYRKVDDFINDWENARAGTIKALEAMTDEKLEQAIVEGHNTLGWLGWHITSAQEYFAGLLGLTVTMPNDVRTVPKNAEKIIETYKAVSKELADKVSTSFTDNSLAEDVDQHETPTPRGEILRTLINHQTHHVGQITVLLRQAGLKVPGVMGPTREDQQ